MPEGGNPAREPPEPEINRMSNILSRKQAILEGVPDAGNLVLEPPEPEIHRLSNILKKENIKIFF